MEIDDAGREPRERGDMIQRQLRIAVTAQRRDGRLDQLLLTGLPDRRQTGDSGGFGLAHG